ncbi:uncharacterized protein LOC114471728 isoform X3 [Gouania willdenowi]|uniref:uncharacterized protein LOC114471728 isoform X3 n=1 Tax=Gouania willdenowi TaxID=441366 RepID=UPI001055BC95|nr:uncharacterized protein LOC114471728 isoform X3 [Gouania willdenowi]
MRQEAREARQLEENARQEHRSRTLQHQFQLLQLEVQARTSPLSEPLLAELEPPDLEQRSDERSAGKDEGACPVPHGRVSAASEGLV